MASLKDKITAFQMLMNDDNLTEQILKQAANAEKSADDAGLEYKETDADAGEVKTEKAKGKVPPAFMKGKKKPADAEEEEAEGEDMEEEEEEAEGEDMEEEEESKEGDSDADAGDSDDGDDAVDDAAEFDEDLDEDEDGEEKEFTDFVGDLPVDAFAEMIATTWKEAFTPVAALLKLSLDAMKEMTTATKEMQDSKAMKDIASRIGKLEGVVKELAGDMPKATKKALRGYRATEDDETVVEGGEEALKETGPGKADPGFLNFMGLK